MSTPTPTDPREEKPEIVHGFELPSGCNATYLDHWNEFAKFYSEKIGGTADPRDSHAKMLLEFYVEGGFQEFQRLQSTASNLTAEIAGLKGMLKDWLRIGPVTGMSMAQYVVASEAQLATLRAELEAARKELFESQMANGELLIELQHCPTCAKNIEQRDTALAAKDAAERELEQWRVYDEFCGITKLLSERDAALRAKDAAEKRVAELEAALKVADDRLHLICGTAMAIANGESEKEFWKAIDEMGPDMTVVRNALTPTPTQEPPAGGVTISTEIEPDGGNLYRPHKLQVHSGRFWRCKHGSTGWGNDMQFIGCDECRKDDPQAFDKFMSPKPNSPDVSALGVEAASHPISTVEKERDHWKATAQLHYNARLELERERDRKGGDSSCAPLKEPTLPELSKCASNSPADVPSEGRGELLPFNLSDALAGKPVVTRDGRAITGIYQDFGQNCIRGYDFGVLRRWMRDGKWYIGDTDSPFDLFMLPTEGSGA